MIRTRFAPSPTGELHIGGARTALFNFLLAKGAPGGAGSFILRIDDTDRERSRPEYEKGLTQDLRWLGLDWDEGPDMGLPVPYRQSERTHIYNAALKELGERVYPCFCSEARLEAQRAEQLARGEPPRYDGMCRRLTPADAKRRIDAGERPCWRFALPDTAVAFHDSVRGDLTFAPDSMGDFVVSRADGQPTYLFTSVVDDRLMEITHIVRGDEHVPNTARQQAIFDALGWAAPVYAHIPMILSPERQKLSKRTGSTPIRKYREEGYLPEALTAYLSTLSWTPGPDVRPLQLLSAEDAARAFSLSRVSVSSPVHDEAHLLHWQKEAMRKRGGEFILRELGFAGLTAEQNGAAVRLAEDLIEDNCTLPMMRDALGFLSARPEPRDEAWLTELSPALRSAEPWSEDELNRVLRAFMKERGLKGKEFFHPLRLALTGRESGAALTLVMCALGRGETLERISAD